MTNKEYIKALINANIYISDFVRSGDYCTFTIKRTDLLNNSSLVPTAVLTNTDVLCALAIDQDSKNFFSADRTKQIIYIGKRTCLDKWVLCFQDHYTNITCTNHKLNLADFPYTSNYISVSDISIPSKALGVRVFNYYDCYTKYGIEPSNSTRDWIINPKHSTMIDYIYLVNPIVNVCNIFKKSIDELLNHYNGASFYKDLKRGNISTAVLGEIDNRAYILEYIKSLQRYSFSSITGAVETLDISEAFDYVFTNPTLIKFEYTKEQFIQDYQSASTSTYAKFIYMLCTYGRSLKYYTLKRRGRYNINITVTWPDNTTSRITRVSYGGRTYNVTSTSNLPTDYNRAMLSILEYYMSGRCTKIEITYTK